MKTILLVDDDDASRAALAEIIRSPQRQVVELADGIDCIALLDSMKPDAIVIDLQMPIFDGERLIDYIAATSPALLGGIIIVSGSPGYLRRREWPVAAVLPKPVDVRTLLAVLAQCA